MSKLPDFAVRPLSKGRWPDLQAVFEAKGCSIARGCWCTFYRHSGRQLVPRGLTQREARKAEARAFASADPPPGLTGDRGKIPVGWVSLGPRAAYARRQRSPVMKPVDGQPVWSVVCLVVPSEFRHQGVATALLRGAIGYAGRRGAKLLEAYPVDKKGKVLDDGLWSGTKSMHDRAGFREVARRRPERPIVRLQLVEA
jgi:ribosomal protein S18 acetylase RimI-like enzyme